MAESGGNGPRDPLTRFLPHNLQEPRPSIKPALLPSQPCVALNFPATGCRLDSSVITIKTDELSTAEGPVIRQDPFGNKAHFIKPVLPFSKGWFCAAGVGAWSHTLQQTPPPTLFIPTKKKRGWRSPALLQPSSSTRLPTDMAHPRAMPTSHAASSIPPLPGCARSSLTPNSSGTATDLALLFAAGTQSTGQSPFTAGSRTLAAGNSSYAGWERCTLVMG